VLLFLSSGKRVENRARCLPRTQLRLLLTARFSRCRPAFFYVKSETDLVFLYFDFYDTTINEIRSHVTVGVLHMFCLLWFTFFWCIIFGVIWFISSTFYAYEEYEVTLIMTHVKSVIQVPRHL